MVSLPLLVGATVASTGGPLALTALYVPGAVSSATSMGLVGLLAAVAFAPAVAIWRRYSKEIVSSGGLYSFVEAAAGRRVAQVQGAVWIVSYSLYLPYTITYIVYDLLPVIFPGSRPYRALLEVTLPLLIVGLGLLGLRTSLRVVGALAAGQLVLLLVLALAGTAHLGGVSGTFHSHGPAGSVVRGGANVALLYVCASLPLFLGAEVIGGSRTVRRGLVTGVGVAAAAVLAGSLMWTHAGPSLLGAPMPGVALGSAAVGPWFGRLIGLGVVASILGVVVGEYFALSRLLHAMSGATISRTTGLVAAGFVVASFLSLINPNAFYDQLVKPSLVALWVSQILVFAVYPRFAHRRHRLTSRAAGLAGLASALMAYGLYSAVTIVSSS